MLWRKESKRNDAIYVDYFDRLDMELADLDKIYNRSRPSSKSNSISDELRNEGNVEFAAKNWTNAIMAYNYAMCFAERDSEALSQAYANRSACFFELDQFDNSYNDVSLVQQTSKCSDQLSQQIEQHRLDCMDFIGNNSPFEHINFVPKLDFEPNDKFPALADVLQIDHKDTNSTKDFGYRITANHSIDVGQTICVEKSLVSKLLSGQYMRCDICLARNTNLVPCENCTGAMFCRGKCQYSNLHEAECNLNPDINDDGKLQMLIRTVSYAINLFNDVDDLVEFVERSNTCTQSDIPMSMTFELAKYQHFLKLKSDREITSGRKLDSLIYFAYRAIMDSKTGEMFISERQKRFLVHLIWQHNAIISVGHVHQLTNKQNQPESVNLFLMFSHFNHSCTANAMYYLVGDTLAIVTLRPIKSREEITISYFGKLALLAFDVNKERKDWLKGLHTSFGTKCVCDMCIKLDPKSEMREKMKDDPHYQFISRCLSPSSNSSWVLKKSKHSPINIEEVKQHAIKFLQKYGASIWCKELSKVAACFMDIVWLESDLESSA